MNKILKNIMEGTVGETGEDFFAALVKNLAQSMDVSAAWVTEYVAQYKRLKSLAFWFNGELVPEIDISVEGSPCEVVLEKGQVLHVAEEVSGEFPDDPDLKKMGMVGYMGIPFKDADGVVVGHLAVFDRKPLRGRENAFFLMRIFAARAAAELRRIRAEAQAFKREEKLARLLDTAPDAILELDDNLTIRLLNRVARSVFSVEKEAVIGSLISNFLSNESFDNLQQSCQRLFIDNRSPGPVWVPEALTAKSADGSSFPAEATLSRIHDAEQPAFILILRNINDRLAAEEKIRSLSQETQRLKEEIRSLGNFDDIIGTSMPLMRLLKDVDQVANTDATVLIHGETGTGKELIAHAIHEGSRRKNAPLIRVNCAAIPAGLMESEFFGHEKGAFTGATQRRVGRFAQANGGTLFLDEVADLDLDLQAKLLRALQESEFEPVGSTLTQKVDVRVIAATNRDLRAAVDTGRFREDLYFRLNVFPLTLPCLRERGDDVALLAQSFAEKVARRLGRDIAPLSPEDITRLKRYPWPGNVRELQNVIERAVITAEGGRLNFDRALPETASHSGADKALANEPTKADSPPIRTAAQMIDLERENIRRALTATGWRISGEKGAARLLGMPPSTLNSRLKALDLKRFRS
jgi:PAS domain S-box-containing protein